MVNNLITPHFSFDEFIHSDVALLHHIDNTPSESVMMNLMRLAAFCEEVRQLLGDKPMIISSGYRCEELNKIVGGVANSSHLYGLACDFIAPDVGSTSVIYKQLAVSSLLFDQLIYEFDSHTRWIHISIPKLGDKSRQQVFSISSNKSN